MDNARKSTFIKTALTDASRTSFAAGVKSVTPFLVGVFPFASITGITMVNVGIDPVAAITFSFIALAGSAQLAAAELISKNAPLLVTLCTALVINLRFMMYSASIAPHFSTEHRRWKCFLAFLLSDQAYTLSIIKFGNDNQTLSKRWYLIGCGLPVWIIWQIGTVMGVMLGLKVPESWSLDFAIPLTFLSLLLPSVKDAASVVAAVFAGGVAVAGANLPFHSGIIVATVTGISMGIIVETIQQKRIKNESVK